MKGFLSKAFLNIISQMFKKNANKDGGEQL